MDHNENHFIENLIFSEQEYFPNDMGEWGVSPFLCFTLRCLRWVIKSEKGVKVLWPSHLSIKEQPALWESLRRDRHKYNVVYTKESYHVEIGYSMAHQKA